MPDRLAVKRLTASDLTFFEKQFRTLDVGNQKSINLNADVFIEKFYPALPDLVATLGDVIPLTLTMLGPGGAGPYVVARAITKREAYKNWRLNGEFVHNPEDQPGRFDQLAVGDLALFEFIGDPGPQKATLLLISARSAADANLYAALNPLIPGGRRTMAELSRAQLAAAAAGTAPTHTVWVLATDPEFDAALEDAALGGTKGATKLAAKPARPLSAAALAAAKAAAEKNGRDGEALAWLHLQRLHMAGQATDIQWVSNKNAVSSFDFSATIEGSQRKIDAKSTNGEFERPIHMSLAELSVAEESEHYDIWRVYRLNADGARLKIAKDISSLAKAILAGIAMPSGITVDCVSIEPTSLSWGEEISISRPEEEETGE
ncbi:MAG TPA: hypothetical protein VFA80_11515 [Xanthobacteraceae bacterium]|nr:hypothetical protein [Xanthobacteraceae bacterium]